MKVSQIKILYKEHDVNEWLKLNHHVEVVSISFAKYEHLDDYFVIHYKVEAE